MERIVIMLLLLFGNLTLLTAQTKESKTSNGPSNGVRQGLLKFGIPVLCIVGFVVLGFFIWFLNHIKARKQAAANEDRESGPIEEAEPAKGFFSGYGECDDGDNGRDSNADNNSLPEPTAKEPPNIPSNLDVVINIDPEVEEIPAEEPQHITINMDDASTIEPEIEDIPEEEPQHITTDQDIAITIEPEIEEIPAEEPEHITTNQDIAITIEPEIEVIPAENETEYGEGNGSNNGEDDILPETTPAEEPLIMDVIPIEPEIQEIPAEEHNGESDVVDNGEADISDNISLPETTPAEDPLLMEVIPIEPDIQDEIPAEEEMEYGESDNSDNISLPETIPAEDPLIMDVIPIEPDIQDEIPAEEEMEYGEGDDSGNGESDNSDNISLPETTPEEPLEVTITIDPATVYGGEGSSSFARAITRDLARFCYQYLNLHSEVIMTIETETFFPE